MRLSSPLAALSLLFASPLLAQAPQLSAVWPPGGPRGSAVEARVEGASLGGVSAVLIGGQGVNAYADPLVSLDLDLVVAVDQLSLAQELLTRQFQVERFPHSIN